MKYQVVDAGYKLGKDKNVMFATNDKNKAIQAAKESGEGVIVLETGEENKNKRIVFISAYKNELGISK